MKRSSFLTWDQLKVGTVVLIAFAILLFGVYKLGQSANLFASRYQLVSFLPSANGLRAGGSVTIAASDVSNPIMAGYSAGQTIQAYPSEGYTAYVPATGTDDVLATQNVAGVGTLPGVVETTTGANNVHFATQDLLGDSNLLSHAIQSVVLGTQPGVDLHTSRQAGILATRMDMDQ